MPTKVIAMCVARWVTRVMTAGKTQQIKINAPLSTRAPVNATTVVETILEITPV